MRGATSARWGARRLARRAASHTTRRRHMRPRPTLLPRAAALAALLLAAGAAAPARGGAQATAYSHQHVTNIVTRTGIVGNFMLLGTGTNTHSYGDVTSVPLAAQDVQPLDANVSCQGGGCAGLGNNQWAL